MIFKEITLIVIPNFQYKLIMNTIDCNNVNKTIMLIMDFVHTCNYESSIVIQKIVISQGHHNKKI